jgi:hypothetical protein
VRGGGSPVTSTPIYHLPPGSYREQWRINKRRPGPAFSSCTIKQVFVPMRRYLTSGSTARSPTICDHLATWQKQWPFWLVVRIVSGTPVVLATGFVFSLLSAGRWRHSTIHSKLTNHQVIDAVYLLSGTY